MKISVTCLIVILCMLFVSCSDVENIFGGEKPNELNGSGDIPIAQVGNTFGISPRIGEQYVELNEDIKIIKNENGVVTLSVVCDIPQIPELKQYIDKIPQEVIKDGKINTTLKFKITNEGIQDYFNADQKAHTLVKYNAKKDDEYNMKKSDGKTISRKVIDRSDKDDFPYGFFDIKTITIEQDSRIAGIKKFIYRANHKFGLVHVQAHMDDGTIVQSYVYTGNY